MHRNIDMTIVRAFLTVAETGSVTKTARLLNLSQGAISQQVKRLEELSGEALFIRQGGRLILAPHGRNVLAAAQQYASANDDLAAALRLRAYQGEVKFGAPYDIIGSYTPAILRRFSRMYPAVRVTLVCKDTILLLADVKSGDVDLALTTELGCGRGGETLRRDRLVWVGAKDGDAHARTPLPLSLGAETCVFRPVAVAALRKARRAWQAICTISNMEPVRATLEADLAVAPLLRHSVPENLDIVSGDKRLPRLPEFRINLYGAAQQSAAVQAFADQARRCVAADLSR